MNLNVQPQCRAALDPDFRPAALWNRAYRKAAADAPDSRESAITLERSADSISRLELRLLADTPKNALLNRFYLERIAKFLLWSAGGRILSIGGAPELAGYLRSRYRNGGERQFDAQTVGKEIFGSEFQVLSLPYKDLPSAKEPVVHTGGHFDGCRIGFDLGGSNRKYAALIDGKTVFTEEIAWKPYFEHDPQYHYREILDTLRRAASHLPGVDAIGGSTAGVVMNNEIRISSLFRGVPKEQFSEHVRPIFQRLSENFPGVPFQVANDGAVSALAGALAFRSNRLLGISLGSSEAVGFVDAKGALSTHLDELAFAPVDYRDTAESPRDEWSGDHGVGVNYLSQQAVGRLSGKAGFAFPPDTPFPEQVMQIKFAMQKDDPRARAVYETLGIYLGYSLAHYADFYDLADVLLLGGVSTGPGGEVIRDAAKKVLAVEFPELSITLRLPDETFKHLGQAVTAASLPECGKRKK